jgi:hypothetical protein
MQLIRVLSAAIAGLLTVYVANAIADPPVKQIQLTEKQVQGLIATQQVMYDILKKLPEEQQNNPPPAVRAQLEANAKKHGFKNYQEYDDVAVNIYLIWSAIDPESKTFTEPSEAIKKDIAEVSAAKTLSDNEKKEALEALSEALNSMPPIQFPGNIELVTKHYDKIRASLN